MPQQTVGTFTIVYTLLGRPGGADPRFGMDFKLTCTTGRALCQLIRPATPIGNKRAGAWSIDNHRVGSDAASIVFPVARKGTIVDRSRERCGGAFGALRTRFAVYPVDVEDGEVYTVGVEFGYSIDIRAAAPVVVFDGLVRAELSYEQRRLIGDTRRTIDFVDRAA